MPSKNYPFHLASPFFIIFIWISMQNLISIFRDTLIEKFSTLPFETNSIQPTNMLNNFLDYYLY